MRRVAPTLQDIAAKWPPLPGQRRDPGDKGDRVRRELRALLAVASVLRRAVKEARSGKASDHIKTLHAAERALARLDKASGGRGKINQPTDRGGSNARR